MSLIAQLKVSLEEIEFQTEVEQLNLVTDQTPTNIDEALDKIVDKVDYDAINEADGNVAKLEAAQESVRNLMLTLESAMATGGMSETAAKGYRIAMEDALNGLPVAANDYTVSSESFGENGDAMRATMEDIAAAKDLLVKIWNGIKAAVIAAFKAVMEYIKMYGKTADDLDALTKNIRMRAAALSGKQPVGTFNFSPYADKLAIDGVKFSGEVGKSVDLLTKALSYRVMAYSQTVSGGLRALGKTVANQSATVDVESLEKYFSFNFNLEQLEKMSAFDKFPGGYVFTNDGARGANTGVETMDALLNGALGYGKVDKVSLQGVDNNLPNLLEVSLGLNAINAFCKVLRDYTEFFTHEVDSDIKAFTASMDALAKRDFSEDAGSQKGAKLLMENSTRLTNLTRGAANSFLPSAAGSVKAGLQMYNNVLKQYESGAAK